MINNDSCCLKCCRGGKLFKQAQKTTTKPTALIKTTAINHTGIDFYARPAKRLWYINSNFMLKLRICCDATDVNIFQGSLRVWCTRKVAIQESLCNIKANVRQSATLVLPHWMAKGSSGLRRPTGTLIRITLDYLEVTGTGATPGLRSTPCRPRPSLSPGRPLGLWDSRSHCLVDCNAQAIFFGSPEQKTDSLLTLPLLGLFNKHNSELIMHNC